MEIFTTKDKKTIIYENGTARVVDVKELEKQKADIEKRLKGIKEPTDAEYLAWGKANMPFTDHSAEVKELEKINVILKGGGLNKWQRFITILPVLLVRQFQRPW
jgi:hypothetical protein